ncbi:MAG: hypothetical protein NW241_09175 [Bacteroidia bacterium]|nr:hypothetical protein [Bacteroidia bacterium]
MKHLPITALLLAAGLTAAAQAQNPLLLQPRDHTRILEQSYELDPGAAAALANRYGNLYVNTVPDGPLRVRLTITSRGTDSLKTLAKLEQIVLAETYENGRVRIEPGAGQQLGGMELLQGMSIQMDVEAPAGHPLALSLIRGDLHLDTRTEPVDIDLKHGSLFGNSLLAEGNSIRAVNAVCSFDSITSARLDLRESEWTLRAAGTLDLKAESSRTDLASVQTLRTDTRVGDLHVGRVQEIRGSYDATKMLIDQIGQRCVLSGRLAPAMEIGSLSPGFDTLAITSFAAPVRIQTPEETVFELDARVERAELTAEGYYTLLAPKQAEDKRAVRRYHIQPETDGARMAAPAGVIRIDSRMGAVKIKKTAQTGLTER